MKRIVKMSTLLYLFIFHDGSNDVVLEGSIVTLLVRSQPRIALQVSLKSI